MIQPNSKPNETKKNSEKNLIPEIAKTIISGDIAQIQTIFKNNENVDYKKIFSQIMHDLLSKCKNNAENEKEFMRLVEELMERGFSQQEAIEEAKQEFERKAIATGGRVGLMGGSMPTGIMRTNQAAQNKIGLK